jgi:hypothetical protein
VTGVVREIRIYVEGGGDSRDSLTYLRRGMGEFLRELRECARKKRIRWEIILSGSRQNAFADFQDALLDHPDAFNVLLVDAEAPVQGLPWQHLLQRDGWQQPRGTSDEQCHLMIQTMETWLVADVDVLDKFYGQGFSRNALPRRGDIEQIEKVFLARALIRATQRTQKGEYHKIRHGAALLELVRPAVVRRAAPSCERLFATLAEQMGGCP